MGGKLLMVVPADRGAVEAMGVVWPSSAGLRGQALNRPLLRWPKTVAVRPLGRRLDYHLLRWTRWKYKRLECSNRKARA